MDLETLVHEGVSIDFQFTTDKPNLGDLLLIAGFENPKFPAKNRKFEMLSDLGFEQVDDYFGIRNTKDAGGEIKVWLFPIIEGEEAFHSNGPFDAIRVSYIILQNDPKNADLVAKIYNQITSNFVVKPIFNGKPIDSYDEVKQVIDKAVQYCRQELKVEPGSDKALELEW